MPLECFLSVECQTSDPHSVLSYIKDFSSKESYRARNVYHICKTSVQFLGDQVTPVAQHTSQKFETTPSINNIDQAAIVLPIVLAEGSLPLRSSLVGGADYG